MTELVESALFRGAAKADHFRAWLLKWTMAVPVLRVAFCHRALRLGILFLFSCGVMLGLSLFFPLWVLAIGPAVYGVPHLVASLRYFHYTAGGGGALDPRVRFRAFAILGLLMVGVAAFRLFVNLGIFGVSLSNLSEWKGSTYLELGAMGAAFAAGGWLYRKSLLRLGWGALGLAPLIYFFLKDPGATVGFLVLAHNFVAFVYWWLAAKTRAEKFVAGFAGLTVSVLSAAIFLGRLDWVSGGAVPELAFARLSFESIGQMITPWSEDPLLWKHAAVAYAFGQALHYFVWLKAIPDQHHRGEMPTSFKQSLRLLGDDFGRRSALALILVCVALVGTWLFLEFPMARAVYFALAGYHGYLEIAGLALAKS